MAIRSVPPASSVFLRDGITRCNTFWNFNGGKTIRYRTDREYEEHFRTLFAESITRRLRSKSPVLAELSGGMDSSSIVCMADAVFAQGRAETPRIDTVSFYMESEPDWNESPYFTAVERQRGRHGFHIPLDPKAIFRLDAVPTSTVVVPGADLQDQHANSRLRDYMLAEGHRVVLSGLGGDEVLGGVPAPTPELEDLLARGHFRTLASRLKIWSLVQRKPWIHLLRESLRGFLPTFLVKPPSWRQPAPWLCPDFTRCHQAAFSGYASRLKLWGPLPSFQENENTLELLRRQIGCIPLLRQIPHEKRYPLLDRDLLAFLYAIPREQLVRPGQRRSLLRRALAGIVPDAVLDRRRKAFVASSSLVQLSRDWPRLIEFTARMRASSLGLVDNVQLQNAFERARNGQQVSLPLLLRTLSLELWLQGFAASGDETPVSIHSVPVKLTGQAQTAMNFLSAEKTCKERR